MVDLQRSMGCIWNIAYGRIQDSFQNSDTGASAHTISRGKSPFPNRTENFIRADSAN
jgi:hypothetical protein